MPDADKTPSMLNRLHGQLLWNTAVQVLHDEQAAPDAAEEDTDEAWEQARGRRRRGKMVRREGKLVRAFKAPAIQPGGLPQRVPAQENTAAISVSGLCQVSS